MYAIIESGGKQYKVSSGDVIFSEKIKAEIGSLVELKTIAISGENGLITEGPHLESVKINAKVIKSGKAKKITVFTYKPKKNKKRKMGHRQPYTKLQICDILSNS
jgi:large subunit ribosomal protein L21